MTTSAKYFFIILVLLLIPMFTIMAIVSTYQFEYFTKKETAVKTDLIRTDAKELLSLIEDSVTAFSLFSSSMVPIESIQSGTDASITKSVSNLFFGEKGIQSVSVYDKMGRKIGANDALILDPMIIDAEGRPYIGLGKFQDSCRFALGRQLG